jgi:hypothetical protein
MRSTLRWIAVFLDLEGNRWDLLGPDPGAAGMA